MSSGERKHTFTWKIDNISLCPLKNCEYFGSPIFKAESLYQSSWCIRLYPRGSDPLYSGFMSCFLRRCENDRPTEMECNYNVEIFGTEDKKLFSDNLKKIYGKGDSHGWPKTCRMPISSSNNCYSGDFIVIRLEIRMDVLNYTLRSENSGLTKFNFDELSVKWIVKNLNSDYAEVKTLPHSKMSDFEIAIRVPEDNIEITIQTNGVLTELKYVSCQVTLLDGTGNKQAIRHAVHLFGLGNNKWEFPTFLKRSKLNSEKVKYFKNDSLALQFDIKHSNGTRSESVEYKDCFSFTRADFPEEDKRDPLHTLKDDMKRLYIDKTHSDIELNVNNKTILAHKNILSIRSPVFSAMFNLEMTENVTGSVNIHDLEAQTMESLLEYIYTGTLENLDRAIALKLLVAADKYQVLALRGKCASLLKTTLSNDNVCDVLVVADLVHHDSLQDMCIDYIKSHSECIFFSEEWRLLVENNLQLATKTVTQVSKRMVNW